jgi:hypothetical protein
MMIRPMLAATLLLLVRAQPIAAQVNADSITHRNDCRLASQVMSHGHPAGKREWALAILPSCGALGGQALSHALLGFRSASTWRSDQEDVVMVTSGFHDAAVFDAALEVAGDRAAGKAARIQSFRVLYYQLGWGRVDPYESFLAGAETTLYLPLLDHVTRTGTPLPTDACERVENVARVVVANIASDRDLRAAALKAMCPLPTDQA